jgi:excinuclease UvrABC nuclease subunit
MQLRNEAHRFGIHITAISGAKQHLISIESIPGIGENHAYFNSAL